MLKQAVAVFLRVVMKWLLYLAQLVNLPQKPVVIMNSITFVIGESWMHQWKENILRTTPPKA